jgi:hypothetical protein
VSGISALSATRIAAREAREVAIPRSVARPRASVVLALARIETEKLLTNPAFLVGFGLLTALFMLVTGGGGGDNRAEVAVLGAAIGLMAGALLGANASALRAHRARVAELFGSLPSAPEARTTAIVLAVVMGPMLLACLVSAIAYPVLAGDPDRRRYIDVALLGQVPLTVVALGSFGIALARWIRHPIAAPVALVAQVMTPLIWVLPWFGVAESGMRMGWHYTYLLSAIVLWVSLALAGDRRQLRAFGVPAIALAVVIVSASFQIPPGGLT